MSVGYRFPKSLAARVGAEGGSISFSGRNLWRHQKYPGLDAEANYVTSQMRSKQSYFDTPNPRELMAKLSLTF